jgi:salicylate hydroxylase
MPDQKQRTAIVVGAGLGGLAAAIAFRREGWKVQLLESTHAIGEVGAGIQVGDSFSQG